MRRVLAIAALVLVVAGCTGSNDDEPAPTTEPRSSTTVVDLSGVALAPVGGETTTTIDETGTARLVGTVSGPTGPVAGATVRVDRLVAGREVRHDVLTAADGRWELRDVPGGRYRVRAFQAPIYAQPEAEVRFLADGEEHRFDLVVEDQQGVVVRADTAPDAPVVDGAVNLVVLVAHRTVDQDGIVRSTPAAGEVVELAGLGRWVPRADGSDPFAPSATSQVLSGEGTARFELRCTTAGAPGLSLRVPVPDPLVVVQEVALDLPDCATGSATTTSTTTTASSSTSTTTSP